MFLRNEKLIFLKPRKVAGTSFLIALASFAGNRDIITEISELDLLSKYASRAPQNNNMPIREVLRYARLQTLKQLRRGEWPRRFIGHATASEVRSRLGPSVFDDSLKVSIVRNPYTQLVSLYNWERRLAREGRGHQFDSFGNWLMRHPHKINWNYDQYYIDQDDVIDFYLRFEHLKEDAAALEKLRPNLAGLSDRLSRVHAKPGSASARPIHEYFTDSRLISSVAFFNSHVFERFGYDMPEYV